MCVESPAVAFTNWCQFAPFVSHWTSRLQSYLFTPLCRADWTTVITFNKASVQNISKSFSWARMELHGVIAWKRKFDPITSLHSRWTTLVAGRTTNSLQAVHAGLQKPARHGFSLYCWDVCETLFRLWLLRSWYHKYTKRTCSTASHESNSRTSKFHVHLIHLCGITSTRHSRLLLFINKFRNGLK